jgi:hypothetical protein
MTIQSDFLGTEAKDMLGNDYKVGDKVVRGVVLGKIATSYDIEIKEVTEIKNGKVYLDGATRSVKYPGRMLIVTKVFQ